MVYGAEKQLSEHGDKVPDEMKSKMEDALRDARSALEADDADQIKAATEALEKTLHEIAAAMYQATGGQPGAGPDMGGMDGMPGMDQAAQGAEGGGSGDAGEGGDEVIDAEYEEA